MRPDDLRPTAFTGHHSSQRCDSGPTMTPELIVGLVGLLIGILSVGSALAWLIWSDGQVSARLGKARNTPEPSNRPRLRTFALDLSLSISRSLTLPSQPALPALPATHSLIALLALTSLPTPGIPGPDSLPNRTQPNTRPCHALPDSPSPRPRLSLLTALSSLLPQPVIPSSPENLS